MPTINELMTAAHVPGRPYTVNAMLEWAEARIAELEQERDLCRTMHSCNVHGWSNGPEFAKDGAECGDADLITEDSVMAELVAEDRARLREEHPRAMDDCSEVIDTMPHKETAVDRARSKGWIK
jgi:hypothetical protein